MKIKLRDPNKLRKRLAPALKRIPALDDQSQETIRAVILQTGCILDAVKLDAGGRVATDHGRTLVLAACDLGLKQIAAIETGLDTATLILDDLAVKRHLTKSAIAYLAYPLLETAWHSAKLRRAANLIPGNKSGAKPQCFSKGSLEPIENRTVEDFASEYGMGRNLMREAKKVHDLFEEFESKRFKFTQEGGKDDGEVVELTLREYFEPRILRAPIGGEHESNRPMGLGAVVAGVGYLVSGKNFTAQARSQYNFTQTEFWSRSTGSYCEGFRNWDKVPSSVRKLATLGWQSTLKALPDELWELTLREAERRLKRQ